MGCDIHSFVEVRGPGGWEHVPGPVVTPLDRWSDPSEPFGWRGYRMFGFLANVRNYYGVPTIAPMRGLPVDVSSQGRDVHAGDDCGSSWLMLSELLAYDYDQEFEDKQPFPGDPVRTTVRDHLGDLFFRHLDELGELGCPDDVRVVFWFSC